MDTACADEYTQVTDVDARGRRCPDSGGWRSRLHDSEAHRGYQCPGVAFNVVTFVVACRVAHTRANTKGHVCADAEGSTDEDGVAEAGSAEDASTNQDHPEADAEPDADDEEANPDGRSDGQWRGQPRGVLLVAWRLRLHRRPCADAV